MRERVPVGVEEDLCAGTRARSAPGLVGGHRRTLGKASREDDDVPLLDGAGKRLEHPVEKTGVVLQQYPEGVDFDGEKANLVFGIAGKGEEHLEVLANICRILEDEAVLEKMGTTDDIQWVVSVLSGAC